MRRGRHLVAWLGAVALLMAACSGSDDTATTSTSTSTTVTSTTPAGDTSTTTTQAATTTTSGTDSTTTTTAGSTTSSTAPPSSTTTTGATTTTTSPTDGLIPRPATEGCPQDLFFEVDDPAEPRYDTELASYAAPAGTPQWSIPLGYDTVEAMTHDEQTAFVALGSGLVLALDADSCNERWRLGMTAPRGLDTDGLVVAIVDGDRVRLVDAFDGTVLWTATVGTGTAGRPVISDEFVVVPRTSDAGLVGLWMPTGETFFDVSIPDADGPISGMVADFSAVYLTAPGTVEARWLDDGTVIWATTIDYEPGPPVLVDRRLVVPGSRQGTGLVALYDFDTGEELWRTSLPADLAFPDEPVAIGHGEIHLFDTAGSFHHLDLDDGSTVFTGTYDIAKVSPEFDDGRFLVVEGKKLVGYNLFEQPVFELVTGADNVSRVTWLDEVGPSLVTATWSLR